MKFSFHNKLTIKTHNKKYEFYNKILNSTLNQLSKFEKFNEYISIGNGIPNTEIQNSFHLSNFIITIPLKEKTIQSDISKGELFAKYEFAILNKNLINNITEVGLSDNSLNPTIFNYYSLISNDNINGVFIDTNDEIVFEITIYLNVFESNNLFLTAGTNPFIEFLLGNGLGDIYICNGSNYSRSERIYREITDDKILTPCNKVASISENSLELEFNQNLNNGEIDEILFISDNRVFARRYLKDFKPVVSESITLSPSENYVIKIDDDIQNINSIIKDSNQTKEENYFVSHFANSLGDKLNLPFNNLFNSSTSRFLSKDSKNLFFILNEKVFGYKNEDFTIKELNTSNIRDEYITKIISFDQYVFIISKIHPFISTYILSNDTLEKIENNFESFENIDQLENYQQIDITHFKNNEFALGLITNNKTALTIYFKLNENNNFEITHQISNNKEFNYLLAMYKNNFCDGQIIYLKEGPSSVECRIVTHSSDKTETDIYSSLAYHLTKDATNIYCKNRAIISEKKSSPSIIIYYYPQIYEYNLPLISNEISNHISNNLNYIIQKHENNNFKIYNLIGYNNPEEFKDTLSNYVDLTKILDFEFMQDTLLIFLNDEENPIVAFNLKLNKTQIENISDKNSSYLVNLNKYNKLGKNNEIVNFSFSSMVRLWYFLIKFLK